MNLGQLRDLIEQGRTAKHRRFQSVLSIYVKKKSNLYILHAEGYINPIGQEVVRPKTSYYQTWDELLRVLGYDAEQVGWSITNEPLRDYFPTAETEQTPPDLLS